LLNRAVKPFGGVTPRAASAGASAEAGPPARLRSSAAIVAAARERVRVRMAGDSGGLVLGGRSRACPAPLPDLLSNSLPVRSPRGQHPDRKRSERSERRRLGEPPGLSRRG